MLFIMCGILCRIHLVAVFWLYVFHVVNVYCNCEYCNFDVMLDFKRAKVTKCKIF